MGRPAQVGGPPGHSGIHGWSEATGAGAGPRLPQRKGSGRFICHRLPTGFSERPCLRSGTHGPRGVRHQPLEGGCSQVCTPFPHAPRPAAGATLNVPLCINVHTPAHILDIQCMHTHSVDTRRHTHIRGGWARSPTAPGWPSLVSSFGVQAVIWTKSDNGRRCFGDPGENRVFSSPTTGRRLPAADCHFAGRK